MGKANTLIIGCGRLGASIARNLSEDTQNVVIIDRSELAFKKLNASFSGISVVGDATQISVLEEAEINEMKTAIIVTDVDNVNILLGELLIHRYHVEDVVIRLTDPELVSAYQEKGFKIVCPTLLSVNKVLTMCSGGEFIA
ncbi:NAD-binding protein [Allofustis seminis]|uniref:NAD-binding protein n=1 Tax=Allofustis seminis TaxID=166939 RepID=UPI000360B64B|nr:NAD-binding protein [Allofustis seminis]